MRAQLASLLRRLADRLHPLSKSTAIKAVSAPGVAVPFEALRRPPVSLDEELARLDAQFMTDEGARVGAVQTIACVNGIPADRPAAWTEVLRAFERLAIGMNESAATIQECSRRMKAAADSMNGGDAEKSL